MFNSPENIALRRYQNNLIIAGYTIILFGVWTVVKMYGRMFIYRAGIISNIREMWLQNDASVSDDAIFFILLILTGIILAVGIAVRLYVGLSAAAEGRGRRGAPFYIPVTVIFIIASISDSVRYIDNYLNGPEAEVIRLSDYGLVSVIIELTSLIILIRMAVTAIKVRKLKKKLAAQGE